MMTIENDDIDRIEKLRSEIRALKLSTDNANKRHALAARNLRSEISRKTVRAQCIYAQ